MNKCTVCKSPMMDNQDYCPDCGTQMYPETIYFLIQKGTGKILQANPILKNVIKKWMKSKPGSCYIQEGHVMFEDQMTPSEIAIAEDAL